MPRRGGYPNLLKFTALSRLEEPWCVGGCRPLRPPTIPTSFEFVCVLLSSVCLELLLPGQGGVAAAVGVSLLLQMRVHLRLGGPAGLGGVRRRRGLFEGADVAAALHGQAAVAARQVPAGRAEALSAFLLFLGPHVQGLLLRAQPAATQRLEGPGGRLEGVTRRSALCAGKAFLPRGA